MRILIGVLLVLALGSQALAFNSNSPGGAGIVGGTCTGGQVMGGISSTGVITCVTPTSAGSYPAGSPPQVGGFSAANVAEAETVGGDFTYTRAGANSYTATVTKTNGIAFSGLATAAIPLSIANGGLGSSTAPTVGQIPIATTTSLFTPTAISGDATLASTGALTVTKLNGVAPGPLYSATTPLSIANGGRGSGTAPTAGQIDVAQSTTALGFVSMSGDATIAATGAITVTKTNGIAFSALATAAVPLTIPNGGTGNTAVPTATGQILIAQTGLVSLTPQTVSGDATLTAAGALTVTKLNGTTPGGSCAGGSWVSSISASGVPTCTVVPAPPALPLSIANGGRGSGTAPTAGQIDVAQSTTALGFVTMSGDATITSAGVISVTKLNGTTPGGTCTSPQFVQTISSSGVPTCATPSTGSTVPNGSPPQMVGYAAANTPEAETVSGGAGSCAYTRTGANAYTLACPGYAPLASPTFTGTVGMPDGSTIGATGYGSLKTVGIGQAAGSDAIDITNNQNANTGITINNNSTGTAAADIITMNSSTHRLYIDLLSTGNTGPFGADVAAFDTNAANGIVLNSQGTGPIKMQISGAVDYTFGTATMGIPINYNGQTGLVISNASTGASNNATLQLTNNVPHSTYIQNFGSAVAASSYQQPDSTAFVTTDANGFYLASPQVTFWTGGVNAGSFTSSGLNVNGSLTVNGNPLGHIYFWQGQSTGVNYTTTSASYVNLDASKFSQSITVPNGWSLVAGFDASAYNDVTNQWVCVTWGKDGTAVTNGTFYGGSGTISTSAWQAMHTSWVWSGDGAAHTYSVMWASCGGSGTAHIINSGYGQPVAVLEMLPAAYP